MYLIHDWRLVLAKAWSVKFNIASALFGGLEVAVQFAQIDGVSPGLFAAFAAIVSMLAVGARVLAQSEITDAPAK